MAAIALQTCKIVPPCHLPFVCEDVSICVCWVGKRHTISVPFCDRPSSTARFTPVHFTTLPRQPTYSHSNPQTHTTYARIGRNTKIGRWWLTWSGYDLFFGAEAVAAAVAAFASQPPRPLPFPRPPPLAMPLLALPKLPQQPLV